MNKIEEFQRVCKLSGLLKVNDLVYTTPDKLEAIEFKNEKYTTFWNKTGERVYDQPCGSKIQLAYEGLTKQSEPRIEQEKSIIQKDTQIIPKSESGLMPENLTNALFQKWQKMPVEERLIMLQTTDKQYIEERKGRGGKMYPYVKGSYMVQCANMAFGFSWSSQVQQWEKTDTEIICMGYIEAEINGKIICKYAIGQQDIAFVKDTKTVVCLGDNYKAAHTDMIKKALSFFGIAKDVYSGEV